MCRTDLSVADVEPVQLSFPVKSLGSAARTMPELVAQLGIHGEVGGATYTILAATVPLLLGGAFAEVALKALTTLVVSHLIVQLVKRTVGRPRPSRSTASTALVIEPDRFSFPSGHAAAAMSVAFVYVGAFPSLALPLVLLAGAVGMSRVFLGVHYPGDVLIGQLIAVLTGLVALQGWP